MPQISALYIYPIKSCAPIQLSSVQAEMQGLKGDRRFMVVDGNGRFMTSRKHHDLIRVQPLLTDRSLQIRAPGFGEVSIDFEALNTKRLDITVWKSVLSAQLCSAKADQFFSDYLERECHLVYKDAAAHRLSRIDGDVSFADAAPALLISEASLDDLNTRLEKPVSMSNFRPNICVSGLSAFEEDGIERASLGKVPFTTMGNCGRCIITTLDPVSGQPYGNKEPLKTLSTYRRGKKGQIDFGHYISPLAPGLLSVGDPVNVDKHTL